MWKILVEPESTDENIAHAYYTLGT